MGGRGGKLRKSKGKEYEVYTIKKKLVRKQDGHDVIYNEFEQGVKEVRNEKDKRKNKRKGNKKKR